MRGWLALLVCSASVAHAGNPRDLFGIPHKGGEPTPDCGDGRDFGCAAATDPLAEAGPFALATWLDARYLLSLPIADATHDEVAHYALGVGRDEAGLVIAGATGLENRWTVDGAPTESAFTGAAETRVPLSFLDGILVTTGGFTARDRVSTGGTIDAQLRRGGDHHELEAYVWQSFDARGRQPALPFNRYQVRHGAVDALGTTTANVVGTGPLGSLFGGKAWYAAGLAPSFARYDVTWTARRLVDHDNDGIPDGVPGLPEEDLIETLKQSPLVYVVPAMARAGLDRGPHHVEVTLLGTASSQSTFRFNSTVQAAGIDQSNLIGDAIATYRGEWQDTHLRAQFAWHHSSTSQSARDPLAANTKQLLSAYVPSSLPEDPALAGACDDTTKGDPYPSIANCPVPIGYFASAGAGELVDTTSDRPSITVDAAHRIGDQVLRVGATGEDTRFTSDSRFTGGAQDRSLFPGQISERQFLDPVQACSLDPAQPCPTVNDSHLAYRTRYTAAYVEDTWRPAQDIVVDGGLRWELMWVGPTLHFSDELAPRFGASWDPLGGGRSRVWTSAGRSFALLPAGLGTTVIGTDRTVDTQMSTFGTSRTVNPGAPIKIIPGLQPIAQDELTLGGEVALARAVRARGWLQGRWLERGLETTTDGFDNPGRSIGSTGVAGPPAMRDTELIALEVATAPTAKLVLRVGYMYATTSGSWVGPFDPREGAVLFASTDFEVTPINLVGPLPTDLGHRLYFEASKRGRVGDFTLIFATRMTVASGRPRDVLADGAEGLIYLIPRGTGGRDPMVTQANMRLGASWHGYELTLDLLNVFDRRTSTETNAVYASEDLVPIQGGRYSDVVFLRTETGRLPQRETTFQLASEFQAPFSAVLGLHRAF